VLKIRLKAMPVRKMMSTVLLAAAIMLCPMTTNKASAVDYPPYLDDNPDIEYVYGHMDYGHYIDKSSVVVTYSRKPILQIAANELIYDAKNESITSVNTNYYNFNANNDTVSFGKTIKGSKWFSIHQEYPSAIQWSIDRALVALKGAIEKAERQKNS